MKIPKMNKDVVRIIERYVLKHRVTMCNAQYDKSTLNLNYGSIEYNKCLFNYRRIHDKIYIRQFEKIIYDLKMRKVAMLPKNY